MKPISIPPNLANEIFGSSTVSDLELGAFYDALSELSEKKRLVIMLSCFERLPVKEVAARSGLAYRSVFQYKRMAKAEIKRGIHIKMHDVDYFEIYELGLSTRAVNSLRRANCKTVKDILDGGLGKLFKVRGLGEDTMNEILEKLKDLGYQAFNNGDPFSFSRKEMAEHKRRESYRRYCDCPSYYRKHEFPHLYNLLNQED